MHRKFLSVSTITGIIIILLSIISCKKTADVTSIEDQSKTRQEILNKIKERQKNEPQSFLLAVNLPGKGYYGDIDGNIINRTLLSQNRSTYECPDPSDDYFSQAVTSIKSEFTCNQGFRIEVTYEVSVLYNLVTVNPNNSSQLSKGKLRLKNSGGSVIWSNTNITPVSITNLGTDPSESSTY